MRLIAFPFHDWRKGQREGFRTRDLHVLKWLARRPDVESVLVVDRPVSLAERLLRRQGWCVAGSVIAEHGFGRRRARLTQADNHIIVLDQATPDVVSPILKRRGWWFAALAGEQTMAVLRWAIAETGPIDGCIAWHPAASRAVERIGTPFVFDSLDNWLIHPAFRAWQNRSRAGYEALLPKAEAVFVSAPASRAVLSSWRDDIEIVPNGVDLQDFESRHARPGDLPAGEVVGYVGKLARRIDAALVSETAAALPDVHFVFVGPVLERHAVTAMRGIRNVHLLGDRHYSAIPSYVQHFTIGWIPHAVGDGETGGDPIKLYEYWAAGIPVVSTRIDGMETWADRIALVDDASEATAAIDQLLRGELRLPPPVVPHDRTWSAITERLVGPLTV